MHLSHSNLNVARLEADKLSCSEPRALSGNKVQDIEDWAPQLLSLYALCLL